MSSNCKVASSQTLKQRAGHHWAHMLCSVLYHCARCPGRYSSYLQECSSPGRGKDMHLAPKIQREDMMNSIYKRYHGRPSICCCCLIAKLCLTLCNPMDYSLPGSSVHGIFQARILKWVAISFSRGSSWPRDQTCVSCVGRWILYHWTTWEAPD